MDPGRGWLRVLRGLALAACCVLLGMSGHAIGGATLGLTTPVVLAAVLIGAGSVAWAGRQRDFVPLLRAAGCAQVAFHLVLSLFPAPVTAGHEMHPAAPLPADVRMLLGHALGAVVMAWVLARGDALVYGLYRSLRAVVVPDVRDTRPPPAAAPRLTADRADVSIRGVGLRLAAAVPRRGPPQLVAVGSGVVHG